MLFHFLPQVVLAAKHLTEEKYLEGLPVPIDLIKNRIALEQRGKLTDYKVNR